MFAAVAISSAPTRFATALCTDGTWLAFPVQTSSGDSSCRSSSGKTIRRLGLEPREGVEVAPHVRDAEPRRRHVLLGLRLIGEGALHVELRAGAALLAVAGQAQVVLRDLEVLRGRQEHRLVAEQRVIVAQDALFYRQSGGVLVGARARESGLGGVPAVPVGDLHERHGEGHVRIELVLRLDDDSRGALGKRHSGRRATRSSLRIRFSCRCPWPPGSAGARRSRPRSRRRAGRSSRGLHGSGDSTSGHARGTRSPVEARAQDARAPGRRQERALRRASGDKGHGTS